MGCTVDGGVVRCRASERGDLGPVPARGRSLNAPRSHRAPHHSITLQRLVCDLITQTKYLKISDQNRWCFFRFILDHYDISALILIINFFNCIESTLIARIQIAYKYVDWNVISSVKYRKTIAIFSPLDEAIVILTFKFWANKI